MCELINLICFKKKKKLPLINNDFPKSSWPLNVREHMHLIRLLLTWDKEFTRLLMETHLKL
jgi:hypothetical protein